MRSSLLAVSAVALTASLSLAALPNQPIINPIPTDGEIGVYSVQDQAVGPSDPLLAKAYDNFTLADDYFIDGFCWSGVYAEPLPGAPSDTDFIVEIWGTDAGNNNYADTGSGPLLTFTFEGGAAAGMGGADLTVTPLGHTSNATGATPGGGPAFSYATSGVTPTVLAAGDYWISIIADQRFDSPNAIDPEWQWHLGDGPDDGFTTFDRIFDMGPEAGMLIPEKDLAFEIKGRLVPEPSSMLMTLLGGMFLGLWRRRRK